jgi:hypothetical protein
MATVNVPHPRTASGSPRATPLYHASVAGLSGLAFQLADRFYFISADDPGVYRVEDPRVLLLSTEVAPDVAAFLTATILEPRLLALTGRA